MRFVIALADSPRAMTENCQSADRPQIEKCLRDCATACGDVAHRDADGLPLPNQNDKPLAAGDAGVGEDSVATWRSAAS